jgi:hypothetical protein
LLAIENDTGAGEWRVGEKLGQVSPAPTTRKTLEFLGGKDHDRLLVVPGDALRLSGTSQTEHLAEPRLGVL